jgi:hypothetical protein
MWGGAPDQRPSTQAADVTARMRPDKAARDTLLTGLSHYRARNFGAALILRYSPPIAAQIERD